MTFIFSLSTLWQTPQAGHTPIWVILTIVLLIVALFVWGVVNSSGALGQPNSSAGGHDDHQDDHH